MNPSKVHVIGAGLAGSEAAFFLAERGVSVILHEMRPGLMTPAHKTEHCAELVCSNSLKSKSLQSAHGILKTELKKAGSLILRVAEETAVPAGEALAVDRELFAGKVSKILKSHPQITYVSEEVTKPIPDAINIFTTGPLTSETLTAWLAKASGFDGLYFYDAIAPVIEATSIDLSKAFLANRYDKGEEDAYLNCPMNEEEYYAFVDALLESEHVAPKPFEKEKFFQGCQPIEAIANTGRDSLRFGPMKPVGLIDPTSGKKPYAVVQLRPENATKTAYNLVGFQTKLRYGEQEKVLRLIPALAQAEFLRLGSIHRNTYVCAPNVLRSDLSLKGQPTTYLAGQLTGVEGYVESTACGLLAACFVYQRLQKRPHSAPPANTALGALLRHVTGSEAKNYQPSNCHFGLLNSTYFRNVSGLKRDEMRKAIAEQAVQNFDHWWNS